MRICRMDCWYAVRLYGVELCTNIRICSHYWWTFSRTLYRGGSLSKKRKKNDVQKRNKHEKEGKKKMNVKEENKEEMKLCPLLVSTRKPLSIISEHIGV